MKYGSGYKYQLEDEEVFVLKIFPAKDIVCEYYTLTTGGILTIKKGYAWDGPSGPTIDTKDFMLGSLVHDAIYQMIGNGYIDKSYRKAADQELIQVCKLNGMGKFRCFYVYWGVRLFGGSHLSPDKLKEV